MPEIPTNPYSFYVLSYNKLPPYIHALQTQGSQDGWTLNSPVQLLQPIKALNVAQLFMCHDQHPPSKARAYAKKLSKIIQADVWLKPTHSSGTNTSQIKLLALDMDSTLIEQEVIDELAKRAGLIDKVSQITEQAMRGELDFCHSFKQRVALLKGLNQSVFQELVSDITLSQGVETLLQTAKKQDCKVVVLSGGFSLVGEYLQQSLPIDVVIANRVAVENGQFTGNVHGEIIDAKGKAQHLKRLAAQFQIPLSQCAAIGDGANDLLMLQCAQLGIAYKPKPIVAKQADYVINYTGLEGLSYLFNWQ